MARANRRDVLADGEIQVVHCINRCVRARGQPSIQMKKNPRDLVDGTVGIFRWHRRIRKKIPLACETEAGGRPTLVDAWCQPSIIPLR